MITTPHKRPHKRQEVLKNISTAGVDLSKLVLYSTFDSDGIVTDDSGRENDGTLSGAFIDSKGRYGKSVFIDNTDDTITFANENDFDISATEDLSIWMWINIRVIELSVICSKSLAAPFYDLELSGGAVITFGINDNLGVSDNAGAGGQVLTTGKWHLVTGVLDRGSNSTSLYIDGVLSGSVGDVTGLGAISNASSFVLGSGTPISIGSNVDIIGISKQAFNINTIQNLFKAGL